MELKTKKIKGFIIIELPDVVNYEVNLSFKSLLETKCKKKNQKVGIDLSRVSFIGSLGIGLLAFAKKLIEDTGGTFYLISPNISVKRIITRTGLQKVFTIVKDESGLGK
jgi:anti-anti-sigma factor